ncbi:MAG TPA: S24 family peptidase [Gemmatimonadaceae bacterium]|nr:S24 family peptidase [Gemmatimonadaceae bacterium]
MARLDDRSLDELMAAVGKEAELGDHDLARQDERFLFWLANDLRAGLDRDQRSSDERAAAEFAERAVTRLKLRSAEKRLPRRQLDERAASVRATLAHAIPAASRERCATILDLAVAAGSGRELWDEPCDRWLELPDDVPSGRYVALRVAGDSMAPVLGPREVILIALDASPRVDDLVVARLPDQSHVVKRVASMKGSTIELASFNRDYESIFVSRDPSPVVGTVIARFTRE